MKILTSLSVYVMVITFINTDKYHHDSYEKSVFSKLTKMSGCTGLFKMTKRHKIKSKEKRNFVSMASSKNEG